VTVISHIDSASRLRSEFDFVCTHTTLILLILIIAVTEAASRTDSSGSGAGRDDGERPVQHSRAKVSQTLPSFAVATAIPTPIREESREDLSDRSSVLSTYCTLVCNGDLFAD